MIFKQFWLGLAILAVLILAMITGFEPLYWLTYVAVGGAVIGYLWLWLQSRGLETQIREISLHPQVGQDFHLKVLVREKFGLPRIGLRARLAGDFTISGEESFSLPPRGVASWTMSGLCLRRGFNNLGPLAMVSGDPAGLLRLECQVGRPQDVLVYPATVELQPGIAEGQAAGGEMREAGQMAGHSPAASMVRQYVPGDSLTRIHWPTTARLNQLMTKEFEGAGIGEIWLFLDLQEASHVGRAPESTEEYCITIAASLAKGLMAVGHSVGLVTQGDQFHRLAPDKDPNHLWALLRSLALVRARGHTPLATVIAREAEDLGAGNVAIVVTPSVDGNTGNLLQFLGRHGPLVIPILLDVASFDRPADRRWISNTREDMREPAFVVRRADDLSTLLASVLDRIVTY